MDRRTARHVLAASAVAILVVGTGGAGSRHKVRRAHTRPALDCGIPPRDYIQGAPSLPALAVSSIAELILVPDSVPDRTLRSGRQAKYYRLKTNLVQVDHCSVSRVSLAVRDDGYYVLSLRADQNPLQGTSPIPLPGVARPNPAAASNPAANVSLPPVSLPIPGASPVTKFTAHIKRNLFTIRVRGYAAYPADANDNPDAAPGRPVMIQLPPEEFWVQRGVPLFPRFEGNDPQIAEFFRAIDRVEIELTYR